MNNMKRASWALILMLICGCSASIPRREPPKEMFPTVRAETLDGKALTLPADLRGAPAILLVGYAQRAQFDIDRWILGLQQLGDGTKLLEVPTIKGMLPGLAANMINQGMRRGIPSEDWSSVATVYADAGALVDLTGNENPNNARVFLLDAAGRVAWFYDRGYSAAHVSELTAAAKRAR